MRARCVSSQAISPSVRLLHLECEAALDYRAGQWCKIFVRDDQGEEIARDYSIANAPGTKFIEFAVTHVLGGPMSTLLHDLAVGGELELQGPNGFFYREPHELLAPALYVATGTGVAPLRAMIQQHGVANAKLLFGCRTVDEVIFADEWSAMGLVFVPTLSRGDERWTGHKGYVQSHLRELLVDGAHVYVCGLRRMVDEVRRVLREEMGIERGRVHSERYD